MSSMKNVSNAFLVDTNVLVYAHDPRDRDKQQRALLVINSLVQVERAVLSVQCLSEFFRIATRRLSEPMTPTQAEAQVERFARAFRVLDLTLAVVLEGCRGSAQHNLPLWDALIWAVAKLNQVPCVLTEDAAHGRLLEGVRFMNPFAPAFDLAVLAAEQ